ncbi:MAG: DnaB-like helicase C-terminal domain-containing protein [Bacilli bacterium]|jgi:hypothetical protein
MSKIYVLIDDRKKHDGAKTYYDEDRELFAKMNKEGWGIYFAVNDFGTNPRQDQYCQKLRYVYGDLDIAKSGDGQTREDKDKKKQIVIDALIAKCPPSFIIGTSNGIQPLWRLKDGDPKKRTEYVRAIKGVIEWSKQYGCKADRVYDTARILRNPGYFHMKEEPYMCDIVYKSENRYTILELNEIFPYVEEEAVVHVPIPQEHLTPVDIAMNALDIKEIVTKAYNQTGRTAVFDRQGRLILDGRLTGTFQGKKDNRDYISSSSHEPIKGNRITVVADILQINNKEARAWILKEFNINWATEQAKQKVQKQVVPTKDYKLRYTWGTQKLDDNFAIIKRKTFIVLAAKRGSGKTTYAFDMACKNAKLGHRVLFVSLEMEKEHIKEDFARRRAGITIPEEREYRIPNSKKIYYEEKIKEIDDIKTLFFSGIQRGSDISWDGVKLLIAEHKDLDLVIIDNLDLIDKNEGERDDWEKQKRIVKSIMNFTADQQIPIILIHHYRKSPAGQKGGGMDELSGSGKIADSADYIVKVSRTTDPEAVYPDNISSKLFLQKARGYNESLQDVYFVGGTFVDEAPADANPKLKELNEQFPDEDKEVEIKKPYKEDNDKLPF